MTTGFLVFDKPAGITSHDAVAAVRAVTGIPKVGHTGTLDPFATGVLPLALGAATKLIQFLDESEKVYNATVRFGATTDTGDPTGTVTAEAPLPTATEAMVDAVLQAMVGPQMQRPPAYSAVKLRGRPLYKYAREGVEVEVPARPITLYGLELLSYRPEELRLRIRCSRGTYARVLADDIATALGTAGHLVALSRERSGPFALEDSLDAQGLANIATPEEGHPWQDVLLSRSRKGERVQWRPRDDVRDLLAPRVVSPLAALSHLPLVDVDAAAVAKLRQGGISPAPPPGLAQGGRFLIVHGQEVISVGELHAQGVKLTRLT